MQTLLIILAPVIASSANSTSTTTQSLQHVKDVSEELGVKWNTSDDLEAVLSGLRFNTILCLICALCFSFLRKCFPRVYCNNVICNLVPCKTPSALFDWLHPVDLDSALLVEAVGLDNVLVIEFFNLAIKLMAVLCLPLLFGFAPLYYFCGRGDSVADKLRLISMDNVQDNHPWLFYVHAAFVWYVCISSRNLIFRAQARFLEKRFEWLLKLPSPRNTTIMVERIPEDYRSDARLREFFKATQSGEIVEFAQMVRHSSNLVQLCKKRATLRERLRRAKRNNVNDPQVAEQIMELTAQIEEERLKIATESVELGGVNSQSGFVTFRTPLAAERALDLRYSANMKEWVVSVPPDASDVIWTDLLRRPTTVALGGILGHVILAFVFLFFMSIVGGIAALMDWLSSNVVHAKPTLEPYLQSLVPTLALELTLSFLPTIFLLVYNSFFTLKSTARSQHDLQKGYFSFLVVYVLLAAAIGISLLSWLQELINKPADIFLILAERLPQATHFYMNLVILQWTVNAKNLLRYMQLLKYLVYRYVFQENEECSAANAEPEDQDYYGIGSRTARFTITVLIGVIYSTISPFIAVLVLINCMINRIVYGYLVIFAETKKPDLGGAFWVTQLEHLWIGIMIYCVLMTGLLLVHAPLLPIPMLLTLPSIFYLVWQFFSFRNKFRWDKLPINVLLAQGDADKIEGAKQGRPYVQPELREDLDDINHKVAETYEDESNESDTELINSNLGSDSSS